MIANANEEKELTATAKTLLRIAEAPYESFIDVELPKGEGHRFMQALRTRYSKVKRRARQRGIPVAEARLIKRILPHPSDLGKEVLRILKTRSLLTNFAEAMADPYALEIKALALREEDRKA